MRLVSASRWAAQRALTSRSKATFDIPLTASAVHGVKSLGLGFLTGVDDKLRRAWMGSRVATLADLFAAPDSARRIAAISERGAATPIADAMLRQVFETPMQARGH